MEQIRLGDQMIRYDPRKTRTAYAAIRSGSAENCNCLFCRNFMAQRNLIYSDKFRKVLDDLGIDPVKEGDVYELGPQSNRILYGGWFYLAGAVVDAGERLTDGGSGLEYFFRGSHPPRLEGDFGKEVLALEFSTKLPWVLSEPPEWPLGLK